LGYSSPVYLSRKFDILYTEFIKRFGAVRVVKSEQAKK
jgi:hypothetical protein